jgi:drug/metabolite transporter (DMT)-like permease
VSPLAALILDWVLTAFWPIIGAAGIPHYSGVLFSWAGLAVGLIAMAPWLARRGRWRAILAPGTRLNLFLMGLFSGGATVLYISALAYTTPANAAIMAQVEVLYSALLCAVFLGERLSARQSAASLLIVAGTGLIMAHDLTSPRWKGDLMIVATPWMYQVSHIFSKRLPKDLDPITVAGGRVVYGLVAMAPVVAWVLLGHPRWSWEPAPLLTLLIQGLAMSSLNFVLWYMAILRMDLAKATAIMLSYPALTVLFSWVLGREAIQGFQIIGLCVTFAGAYWVSRLVLQAQADIPARQRLEPEAAAEV